MSEHVGGVYKMKNNNKNYIKEFMNDNGLIINVPFDTIQGGRFFFDEKFRLYHIDNSNNVYENMIGLVPLLTGRIQIISKMERVAKILDIEMNQPYDIKRVSDKKIVGRYILTDKGFVTKYDMEIPEVLTYLLSGVYAVKKQKNTGE